MAGSLLPLLVIFALASILYADEHRFLSLKVNIDSYKERNLTAEGRNRYTIKFTAEALDEFRSCLRQPGLLSCCTDLTRYDLRHYKASLTRLHCKDKEISVPRDVYECFISLKNNLDATSIVCAKVIPQKTSDGKDSPTRWLSISETAGVSCVDVMWGNRQTIQDVQPPTDIQEAAVKLQRGHCQNVSKEPAVSPLTTKAAKPVTITTTATTTTTAAATTMPSSTTSISTPNAATHKEVENENQNEDNKSLFLIIGVAAAVVVVIIIIIIISVVIWRRKKHQKIPITCNTASAYEYIDTTELVSQRDRNIDEAGRNSAVSSSTPLKNDNNKRNNMEGKRSMADTYVSPEEIIRNKRAATACGGGAEVTSDQETDFISNNDTDHYTVPSLQLVSSNTQDSHYETQYDNVETSAQDSTSSATNIYSRLGEQVRNFQNPYSDLNNFKLNATTESCPADVNPSEPSTTTSTENVGPTVYTEPASQPFISTAYEYVDISQPLKNIL